MDLSYRLLKIAEKVPENTILADIGTDHAYVPIFLFKNNFIKKAFACDISKGSLAKAKLNISKYNLSDFIETRLSNGLEKFSLNDKIETIIIAGMGGMLMIDILKNKLDIAQNCQKIILQPQKDIYNVRKFLNQNNFFIEDEEMIFEDGKFYNIIVATYLPNSNQNLSEYEYIFGKQNIDKKCTILKEYILKEISIMENIIKKLQKTNSFNKINDLYLKINTYKEVLKCL